MLRILFDVKTYWLWLIFSKAKMERCNRGYFAIIPWTNWLPKLQWFCGEASHQVYSPHFVFLSFFPSPRALVLPQCCPVTLKLYPSAHVLFSVLSDTLAFSLSPYPSPLLILLSFRVPYIRFSHWRFPQTNEWHTANGKRTKDRYADYAERTSVSHSLSAGLMMGRCKPAASSSSKIRCHGTVYIEPGIWII